MPEPAVIAPGGGEIAGDAPGRRVEILAEDDALHATLTRFGPHRDGADLHVHRRHTDLFYVLAGELTVRWDPAGSRSRHPRGRSCACRRSSCTGSATRATTSCAT